MDTAKPRATPRLVEVGPRDGLQNEKNTVPLDAKVAFIDALSEAGLKEIEVGSFGNPRSVTQLVGSEQVFARIKRKPGVIYSALALNANAVDLSATLKADKISVLAAASELFSQKTTRTSVSESIDRLRPIMNRARAARLPVRAFISTAFWCPFEGAVKPEKVVTVVKRMADLGVSQFSIGDTVGKASPQCH